MANQVRLALFSLAYNLEIFLRRLGLPKAIKNYPLRRVQIKLIKIGAQLVCATPCGRCFDGRVSRTQGGIPACAGAHRRAPFNTKVVIGRWCQGGLEATWDGVPVEVCVPVKHAQRGFASHMETTNYWSLSICPSRILTMRWACWPMPAS